jgi:hypothetical protein
MCSDLQRSWLQAVRAKSIKNPQHRGAGRAIAKSSARMHQRLQILQLLP